MLTIFSFGISANVAQRSLDLLSTPKWPKEATRKLSDNNNPQKLEIIHPKKNKNEEYQDLLRGLCPIIYSTESVYNREKGKEEPTVKYLEDTQKKDNNFKKWLFIVSNFLTKEASNSEEMGYDLKPQLTNLHTYLTSPFSMICAIPPDFAHRKLNISFNPNTKKISTIMNETQSNLEEIEFYLNTVNPIPTSKKKQQNHLRYTKHKQSLP
jgi:hypothetical protein